jgi:hypothetical protein
VSIAKKSYLTCLHVKVNNITKSFIAWREMPKKICSGFLFAVLVLALLIVGVCSSANECVVYASSGIEVDNMPPSTLHNYDGSWYTSNFSITLTATDLESSVNTTYYKINYGPTKTVGADGQPLITEEGADNTLTYWSVDNAGNQETPKMLAFIKLDKTVPKGSITINDGATSTTSTQVKLTLSAEDATSGIAQMRFFDSIYGEWEKYATSKLWTFKTGDAYKTVYVQFRDNAGLFSTAYPATIYFGNTPPADPPLSREPERPQEKLPEKPPAEPQEKPQESNVPKETTPTPPPTPPSASTADMYFVPAIIGIIVAIALVGIIRVRVFRKRQQ